MEATHASADAIAREQVAGPSGKSDSEAAAILDAFAPFVSNTGGIDSWLTSDAPAPVFRRLAELGAAPLSRAQLNELLVLSHEAGLSDGFFRYYWLTTPHHPYDVRAIEGFEDAWIGVDCIRSLEHLRWGLYRFYVDALLFFGSIRSAYRRLRELDESELGRFFAQRRLDTSALERRGPALPLGEIARDDRYLISEMACKSFDPANAGDCDLANVLKSAFQEHVARGGGATTIQKLLDGDYVKDNYAEEQQQLLFAANELLDEDIDELQALEGKVHAVATRFSAARTVALENTRLYLSRIDDLDVYVATSMRTRDDFREMARFCDHVFNDDRLKSLNLRYFDPTLSAADGHEDKGLIECLMVKCAKVLVYFAGTRDSYGKDAEAAMALSLGKPVIFYCDAEYRKKFYRDVHPLSRLIDFNTGVAVGAMVATDPDEVSELIRRILGNEMEYSIDQPKSGYLRLRERLTGSVVRLQTNDALLRETFWNYYHRAPTSPVV
ncbi:MAG TPA: hypothetical protein VN672_05795 [Solirubrobacteraceae bacterium]|nr:hypothetical protein [Solirubrobacteraceae bacterium]